MRPASSPFLALLCLLLLTVAAQGDYTTTLQTLAVTNHTGWVIDADATKIGAPARSVIAGSVSLLYKRAGGVISLPESVTYTLTWSLVDADGVAQALDTGGTSLDTTQVVNWPGTITEIAMASSVNLNPAARLDFSKVYRLRVIATPASNGNAANYTDAVERSYGHFTNTSSPDAQLNVIGVPAYAEIDRDWVIVSPTVPGPKLAGTLFMARYDDFNEAVASANIPVRLRAEMQDVTDPMNPINVPLTTLSADHTQVLSNHTIIGDNPATAVPTFELTLMPQNLNRTSMYQTTAIFEYQEANGDYVSLGEIATAAQRIFPVSGVLWFDTVKTWFTELASTPTENGANWNLVVPTGKGHVDGMLSHTFGGTFVVSINDTPGPSYGDATVVSVTGGSVAVDAPYPDWDELAKVRFNREDTRLDQDGAVCDIFQVYFPTGFTVSVAATEGGLPDSNACGKVRLDDLRLGAALRPEGTMFFTPLQVRQTYHGVDNVSDSVIYCAHEKLPAWFKASSLGWNTATGAFPITPAGSGEFRWVRDLQMTFNELLHTLPASNGNPPLQARDTRPSNDSYLAKAHDAGVFAYREFTIHTDAFGKAVLNASVPLAPTQVRPHYPGGVGTEAVEGFAMSGGTLEIDNNAVNTTTSLLGVMDVSQRYARDPRFARQCDNTNDLAGEGSMVFHPTAATLHFTPDMGLIAEGTVDAVGLAWGTVRIDPGNVPVFAHSTSSFTLGAFYQPGIAIDGSDWAVSDDQRAATLLLSGRGSPGNLAYHERAFHADGLYRNVGAANYAGLNLRADEEPGPMTATSVLSNKQLGPYDLRSVSKYYVQKGGVNGIHERVTSALELGVELYGFPVSLTDFKFSFIDNLTKDSFTNGSIEIPFPAGVEINFESLQLTERGQPHSARLPPGSQTATLDHWGDLPFTAHSIGFREQPGASPCAVPNAGDGFVEIGAGFSGILDGLIPGPVNATLGFKAEKIGNSTYGRMMTAANGVPGLEAKIDLPGVLWFNVPGDKELRLTPITKAAFSNSANITDQNNDNGFLSLAGYLEVPFFTELAVHAHVQPGGNDPGVHFMGGWTDGNGQSYFTHPGSFDASQNGTPPFVDVAAYRRPVNASSTLYRIIARKNWMNVVSFRYPLAWDKSAMRFESPQREPAIPLVLFDLEHNLRSLSANGAELEFGAEIPGLPQINPQRLVLDALDGVTNNSFSTFQSALVNASGLQANTLTRAVSALDTLITDRVDRLIKNALSGPVESLVDAVLSDAGADYTGNTGNPFADIDPVLFSEKFSEYLTANGLEDAIHDSIGLAGNAQNLLNRINSELNTARSGIDTLQAIIQPREGGKRTFFRNLVMELADDNPGYSLIAGVGGILAQKLDELEEVQSAQANPFFGELSNILQEAEDAITSFQSNTQSLIETPMDKIAEEKKIELEGTIKAQVERTVKSIVPAQVVDMRDFLGAGAGVNQARLKNALKQMIMDRIMASQVADRVQTLLRTNFTQVRGILREGTDQLMSQITTTVKDAFFEQFLNGGGQNNPMSNLIPKDYPLRSLGALSEAFQGANLRGYARTNGHSINELRLDGGIKFKPPGMGNGMEFSGYFTYRDNEKNAPVVECLNAFPGAKVEILAGARLGSRSRPQANPTQGQSSTSFFDNMAVGGNLHFAIGQDGLPAGLSGDLEFRGPLTIGIVAIDGVKLAANFSAANQYVRGTADGRILELIKANVDIFAGRVCDLGKLGIMQGPLQDALNQASFTAGGQINAGNLAGVICRIDGSISVNDVMKRFGGVDIPKDLVNIGFEKTTIYALLKKPDLDLKFYLGYLEGGKVKATTPIYTLADASLTLAGVAQAEITLGNLALSAIAGGPAGLVNTLSVKGEASLKGPVAGFPSLDLKIGGILHRSGIRFDRVDWNLMGVPINVDFDDILPPW
ncbi:MAG: hypothetical protein JNJ83_23145 [Verrucomicrobiaceae bacterium]|nr:hypothetical protein [Verrucomicrobiaceae bacterium]